jgi:hypothetical protein
MTDLAVREPEHVPRNATDPRPLLDSFLSGLAFYYFTSLIVVVAVSFAVDFLPGQRTQPSSKIGVDVVSACAAWGGEWYVRIASTGYGYDPERMSSVAFFPFYPSLAGWLVLVTGVRPELALLLVSHTALLATFTFLAAYVQQRFPKAESDLAGWTLLAFGLFPTTFFFRMAYSESLFVMLMLIALWGMERGWRSIWIALVIGLATGTRSVGVALVPVFALDLWRQRYSREDHREMPSQNGEHSPRNHACEPVSFSGSPTTKAKGILVMPCRPWLAWAVRLALLLSVCCWGLLAYVAFLGFVFGEPLAFVKAQLHWSEGTIDLGQRVIGLLTFEPVWGTYDPSNSCYWGRVPPRDSALFNLKAANPFYFLAAVALVAVGARKRWLNASEVLLSAGLLTIPYCLQASRMGMTGQARFASVVFPMYLVLGHLLQRMPAPLAAALLALSGFFLAIYSTMFASWYWFW